MEFLGFIQNILRLRCINENKKLIFKVTVARNSKDLHRSMLNEDLSASNAT
jgi:hypothetical protein